MLDDLYQDLMLEHAKQPRNFRRIADASADAEGFNPLCGDRVHVYMTLSDGRIDDIAFEGSGCAISTASASMMTEALEGRTREEAQALFRRFRRMVSGEDVEPADQEGLDELRALAGVRRFPMRVKCATLPWHAMLSAIGDGEDDQSVKGEPA